MGKRGTKSQITLKGVPYFASGVMGSKTEAIKEAKRLRELGGTALIRKYKAGFQVYGR